MPYSRTNRLARLRSVVTGEPYQSALRAVQARTHTHLPVVGAGSFEQMELEGALIGAITILRHRAQMSWRGSVEFGIRSVTPDSRLLSIRFEEEADIADLTTEFMPVLDDEEITGVPGLRAQPHARGTLLKRPGIDAGVLMLGIGADTWEALHAQAWPKAHVAGACANVISPHNWTQSERDFYAEYASLRRYQRMESLILRRIRLLNILAPVNMHTYTSFGSGVVVEILPGRYDYGEHDDFIAAMAASELEPRLICVERRVSTHGAQHEHSRSICFQIPDDQYELEVRIINPNYRFQP